MKQGVLLLVFILAGTIGNAAVRLPHIITDSMVIQRNKPIIIWGWADPREKITVQFKGRSKKATADKDGNWKVTLQPEAAGGPFQLVVIGKNTITVNDILVGEVWVCSGQSNMEWTVRNANDPEEEMKHGNFPQIRQFLVKQAISAKPEADVEAGNWKPCTPTNVGDFTAVGYFFARELYKELKVPIGLINTSWGGTHSETWTSREAFQQSPEFKEMIASMPAVDFQELARQHNEKQMKRLKDLNIVLPAKDVEHWKASDFDDSNWNTMTLPGLWEDQGLSGLDGVVWFRRGINVEATDVGKEAILEIGLVDDSDEVFVNGVGVGVTKNRYNEKRKYTIPAEVIKAGMNIIAVRVEDTGGGGGIYGDAKDMKITTSSGHTQSLAGKWSYSVENIASSSAVGPNSFPTLLFNAMINPIVNAGIAGVLWYQGEANAGRAYQYRTAFPLMIQDWRNHWKQGDFPFYFVQLASYNANHGTSEKGSEWAELREAQSMTLKLPHTGMAVTTDIGEANDIHPRNKQDVGKRLAAIALHNDYGKSNIDGGPVYKSMKIEGNKIRLSFDKVGAGLMVKDKYGYLKGFEIAGGDHKFYYAKAWIEGNDVIVSADQVTSPAAARFAWADNPEDANLYNKEGFPASPFRTDTWTGITVNSKFDFD